MLRHAHVAFLWVVAELSGHKLTVQSHIAHLTHIVVCSSVLYILQPLATSTPSLAKS